MIPSQFFDSAVRVTDKPLLFGMTEEAKEARSAMLRIKVNGAETALVARERDEGEWLLLCTDPELGEFHVSRQDKLELWWPDAQVWLPVSEMTVAELVIGLAEAARRNA